MISEHEDQLALTVTEAARAAGVDRRALRRRLDGGAFPHAYRDAGTQGPESGPWRIPIGDLLDAGLTVDQPPAPEEDTSSPVDLSQADWLRSALDEARQRMVAAEAEVDRLGSVLDEAGRRGVAAEAEVVRLQQVVEAHQRELRSLRSSVGPVPGEVVGGVEDAGAKSRADGQDAGVADRRDDDLDERSNGDEVDTDPDLASPVPTNPQIAPGAPSRPTPPWVPVPTPAPRRRWWQRSR
jgi:hypothetical protein